MMAHRRREEVLIEYDTVKVVDSVALRQIVGRAIVVRFGGGSRDSASSGSWNASRTSREIAR
jgi:hypothetical protein